MPCVLTKSINLGCRDAKGGISAVYVTELGNKDAITEAAKIVTAFTLDDGKQFWTYEQEIEKAFAVENIQTSRENGSVFYESDLTISLYKGEASTQAELELLAANRLMIIIKDNGGKYWLMGKENGAMLEPSTRNTGTAFGDMNGYTLVFKAKEANAMPEVQASLMATLLAPAA